MKEKFQLAIVCLTLVAGWRHAAGQGTAFSYQGSLTGQGNPATGNYDFTFSVFDAASGGTLVAGPLENDALAVNNGQFNVTLDFGTGVFTGSSLWLEISVRATGDPAFATLSPRQQVLATPYAMFAEQAAGLTDASLTVNQLQVAGAAPVAGQVLGFDGTSFVWSDVVSSGGGWSLTGNGGTTSLVNFLGTTDNQALEVRVDNQRVLRIQPASDPSYGFSANIIGGYSGNYIDPSVSASTIGGGGGVNNIHQILAGWSTIGGGDANQIFAGSYQSTIGGGFTNTISPVSYNSTIAGGRYLTIGNNSPDSTIGGGNVNTIGAQAHDSTIAGGEDNLINTTSFYSTIGGGYDNIIGTNADQCTIAGGTGNLIYDTTWRCTIGGGTENVIATGSVWSTIAGGGNNLIFGGSPRSTISAGTANAVFPNALGCTIPGGLNNQVGGAGSFAAGWNAAALSSGSFVWASGESSLVYDNGPNTFNIYSAGGMYLTSPWGIGLEAGDNPLITRGWDLFGSNAGTKSGHGRWGLFMEPLTLVLGIPDQDVGARSLEVDRYRTDGTRDTLLSVGNNGQTTVKLLNITGGADLAEPFPMVSPGIPKGAVVVIDAEHAGQLKVSTSAYDTRVAGIISGANGINPGIAMQQEGLMGGNQNVALSGRVYVQADASYGAILPGDLLTSSDTPGYAMKVTDHSKAYGAILGKAMSGLKEGKGMLLVLVSLQ